MTEYTFEGETVESVYESYRGDYWIVLDDSGAHPFGYVSLADMRQFAEFGTINRDNLEGPRVWEVPERNWPMTGPDGISIQKKEKA
jgi:hypothetical protein